MKVTSRITSATVFSDRAEITRSATLSLEKGEHRLTFDMLPVSIDENSIQVKGSGNALLKDVKLQPVRYEDFPEERLRSISDERKLLQEKIDEADDRVRHAQKEMTFVDEIARKLTAPAEGTASYEFDPQKWVRLVEFYRAKMDELDREIRRVGAERNELQEKQNLLIMELQRFEAFRMKEKKELMVTLEAMAAGETTVQVVYIVYGPTWTPLYDLRISSEEKKMGIAYHALVRQNTGEDWDEVSLHCSTARPNISGTQPELVPWRVDFYRPQPLPAAAPAEPMMRSAAMKQMFDKSSSAEEEYAPEEELDFMESPGSTVQTGATAVVFSVAGTSSVKSDNDSYRVGILMRDFPARFRYSSVPKLAPFAYLKAQVKNDTEYPFLPGRTNIFLDGNFVAAGSMALVSPGEEFWTSLGVDEGMKIEYRFQKKYESTEGVFSKSTKLVYEYLMIAKNNKKNREELVLWNQLPISGNEEIKISLMEPEYRKNTDSLKMDENYFLEWFFTPAPGEEIRVPFKFSVEFPRGSLIAGLE